ncbi:spore coat protein CotJB [Oscillibacter sp.]|uniref:spore coat protein CotJB n=1 Tax=Oscillibacter sp. TaxID=1945593 RepID=UPI0028B080C6|nr:spore coat protein CotJB [Oscillibacter sp.]
MNRPELNSCGQNDGSLPGRCAPLAFPYVPMQDQDPPRYENATALQTGTLFPGLDLPFKAAMTDKLKINNTALGELMALDFAIDELGLYLTTHPKDQEVLNLYWSYIKLAQEGRIKYRKMYGPLLQTDITEQEGFIWLNDPWPWDEGANG